MVKKAKLSGFFSMGVAYTGNHACDLPLRLTGKENTKKRDAERIEPALKKKITCPDRQ